MEGHAVEGARGPGSGAGRSSAVNEMFRSSRVKVEALDARRVELSQTSASAEDAKSPANHDNRPVPESVRPPSQDAAAPVKYEWQVPRPRVTPLPAEADAQVVELLVVADAAPVTSGERSEQSSRSLHGQEPVRNGGTTAGKEDARSSSPVENALDSAGRSLESRAPSGDYPEVREGVCSQGEGQQLGGCVPSELDSCRPASITVVSFGLGAQVARTWSGPDAGAQPREPAGPGGVALLEKDISVAGVAQGARSRGNSMVPVNQLASQERGLQLCGKGHSYVETLHNLRAFQKTEIFTYGSDEKASVRVTGVNELETSSWIPIGGDRGREHSSGAASGQPSVPRKSVALPDLNEGGPTAAALKPCLDGQQEEQLRAQILVYGALIHGNQIDESLMESAFGDGNSEEYRSATAKLGGKSLWEESWRTTCERLKANDPTHNLTFPAQRTSGRVTMSAATGIHVEAVATLDEVPDSPMLPNSPMSPNSPVSPGIEANEAETLEATMDPSSPSLENAVGNIDGSVPVTSELLQTVDVVTRSIAITLESEDSPVTVAPADSAQGNLLVLVENSRAHVDNLQDPAPMQLSDHADVGEIVGEIAPNLISGMGDKGSSVDGFRPSHAKRSPLNAPFPEVEGLESGQGSEIPSSTTDAMPTANLEATGTGAVLEQIEAANGTADEVARTAESLEGMEDTMTILPTGAAPLESDGGAHQAADTTQGVAPADGVRLDSILTNPTSSIQGHLVLEPRPLERDGSRDGAVSQLDQARLRAEEAAADAAATLQHSTAIWSRVDAGNHSALTADQEDCLVFAAASLAAAASVAKGAAAAAKVAFEAASMAKLLVEESTSKVAPSSSSFGQGVLHAAREQTLKRAEDAAAANKRAQILNAIARAAELATEAAEQTGAVISMGDPLRFTLQDLQQAGINEHWKLGLATENAKITGSKKAPRKKPANRKVPSQQLQSQKDAKAKAGSASPLKAISTKGSASLKNNKKEISEIKGLRVTKKRKTVTVRLKPRPARPLAVATKASRDTSSQRLAKKRELKSAQDGSASSKSPHRTPSVPLSKSTRTPSHAVVPAEVDPTSRKETGPVHDGITEGSVVEVLADEDGLRGAWFSGKVIRTKGGEALVVYDEILADDGVTPLQELVPLGSKGDGAPKIRLAHPINSSKNEGAKKRRRAGNRTWVVGERVDAWIRDGWWEGKIEAVNKEDETKVTVHFPGEGDTSIIKSWDLRPSLVWRNGHWVIASESQAREDEPPAKRQKVTSKPRPKRGKGMKSASTGARGAVNVKSPKAPIKGASEADTKSKGQGGVQDGSKPAKKRKLAEISEDDETGNSRRITSKQTAAEGDEVHVAKSSEKEKGGTKVEKQASKQQLSKSQALIEGEQTPQASMAARTRRTGGQQTIESGPAPETGSKSPKQGTVGQGKASALTKSPKQAAVGQAKISTPAKSAGKGKKSTTSRKKPTKKTSAKETIADKDTPPGRDTPLAKDAKSTSAAKDTHAAKDPPAAKSAPATTPPARGAPPAKGHASSVKSVPPVAPAKGVSASRGAPPVNDVPLGNNVPSVKDVAPSKDVTASKENTGIVDTPPAKDGKRGSRNQPDAGPSAKRQKSQKGGKGRRAPGQDRRKSSRKATPKVVESQGNLNKQNTEQGGKSDLRFGTPRTLNQAVHNLKKSMLFP